jgi:hypothetical protein
MQGGANPDNLHNSHQSLFAVRKIFFCSFTLPALLFSSPNRTRKKQFRARISLTLHGGGGIVKVRDVLSARAIAAFYFQPPDI